MGCAPARVLVRRKLRAPTPEPALRRGVPTAFDTRQAAPFTLPALASQYTRDSSAPRQERGCPFADIRGYPSSDTRSNQMARLVNRHHEPIAPRKIDPVDRAGMLPEPTIPRQRQPQRVQQHDPIDAVMPNYHHGVVRMPVDNIAQRRNDPKENILQRLPTRDRRPVRSAMPGLQKLRPAGSDLVRRQPLPLAIIDVDQAVERARRKTERGRDRVGRRTGPAERAGKDSRGAPRRVDATRGCLRLPLTFGG